MTKICQSSLKNSKRFSNEMKTLQCAKSKATNIKNGVKEGISSMKVEKVDVAE